MMGQWPQRGEGRSRPRGPPPPGCSLKSFSGSAITIARVLLRHRALVTSQLLHCWHLDVKIGLCGSARIRS